MAKGAFAGTRSPRTFYMVREMEEKEKASFVIEFDLKTQGFGWKVDGNIPIPLLVGSLELAKSCLLDQQKAMIAQQMQQQAANRIVLPNGPIQGPFNSNRLPRD